MIKPVILSLCLCPLWVFAQDDAMRLAKEKACLG